jgi:hypothetical protein
MQDLVCSEYLGMAMHRVLQSTSVASSTDPQVGCFSGPRRLRSSMGFLTEIMQLSPCSAVSGEPDLPELSLSEHVCHELPLFSDRWGENSKAGATLVGLGCLEHRVVLQISFIRTSPYTIIGR